jgi:RNA polymerase sigma-70 factor (ECF subfamily)
MSDSAISQSKLLPLVKKAQQGDSDAYGEIYNALFPGIYRFVKFRVHDALAEDITADIFVKAWQKIDKYKAQKSIPFSAWVYRIARNTVIDNYRKQENLVELGDYHEDKDALNQADTETKKGYLVAQVQKAMAQLPKRYFDVLHLTYIANLSNEDASAVLKIKDGALRTLKSRALLKLKEHLPPELATQL